MMKFALLCIAATAGVAWSASLDTTGTWEAVAGSSGDPCSKLLPSVNLQFSQCGDRVIVGPVDASGVLVSTPAVGTFDASTNALNVSASILNTRVACVGTTTSSNGGAQSISGGCYTSGASQPLCALTLECKSGNCMTDTIAPTQGAGKYPSVGGEWKTNDCSCSAVPGFAPEFDVTQCDSRLLVVPEDSSLGPNIGSINAGGLVDVGLMKGSTVQCTGIVSGHQLNGTCTNNGSPFCDVSVTV